MIIIRHADPQAVIASPHDSPSGAPAILPAGVRRFGRRWSPVSAVEQDCLPIRAWNFQKNFLFFCYEILSEVYAVEG